MIKLEQAVNEYGQKQIIKSDDRVIKIEGFFLQVRLIRTQKWKDRNKENPRFTAPMPRAKFVRFEVNPYYLIRKDDLEFLKFKVKEKGCEKFAPKELGK